MSSVYAHPSWVERASLIGTAVVIGAVAASLIPSAPSARAELAASVTPANQAPEHQPDGTGDPHSAGTTTVQTATNGNRRTATDSGLGETMKDGLVITGATPHRLILFTFDDGPDRRTTPLLLDRLDSAGVRAVFFLTGNRLGFDTPTLRQQSMIAQEIRRRGHWVASHTYDHLQLPLLNDAQISEQIDRAQDAFVKVFGERPWLLRPPGGGVSDRVLAATARRGYTTVLWNLGAGDFQVRSADQVLETWRRVYSRLEREGQRGGIVLLHDTYAWSVEGFQHILNDLRDRNCQLLELGEELFDIVDDPALFFAARGDAHPNVQAPPLVLPPEVLEQRQAKLRTETAARCRTWTGAH